MDLEERKVYVESAKATAPAGLYVVEDPTKQIPTGHRYAIVEILEEAEHGTTFMYVATGNREGIIWAWQHAQEHHPRFEAMKIMDLSVVEDGGRIDFH